MKGLLIPSAVLVSRDMRSKFGEIPTALFPLENRTMIERLYEKYKGKVDKFYIVVFKKSLLIKDYIDSKKLPVEIIELDILKDLGYTIQYGLKRILQSNPTMSYVYVNFADSLLDDELPSKNIDCIYYATQSDVDEWTYFKENGGNIQSILDKGEVVKREFSIGDYQNIFVGVFGFSHPQEFLSTLEKASQNTDSDTSMDSFYKAVYNYSHRHNFDMLKTRDWFDVGHSENYAKAKTSVAARSFNSIEIDEKRGILKKRSENKEKLVNEIRWYLRLPNKLQYLLPRIYEYSLDLNNPYVSMEYYGYHTLHESLLFGDLPLVKWQDIFKKILFALKDMENYSVDGTKEEFNDALRDIYLQKTFSRLDKMRNQDGFSIFFTHPVIINGEKYLSINEYIALLPKLVEKIIIKSFSGKFHIIHGDLCFANILIEDTYDFIRLIDPRGKFGGFDIYGDTRYELAKLMHTLEGKYDFIIEDMFEINVNKNNIIYQINTKANNILNVFFDVFKEQMKDIQAIRLIESTLFLSMIPLHADYKQRQYAMLATGIMLLDRVIQDNRILEEIS